MTRDHVQDMTCLPFRRANSVELKVEIGSRPKTGLQLVLSEPFCDQPPSLRFPLCPENTNFEEFFKWRLTSSILLFPVATLIRFGRCDLQETLPFLRTPANIAGILVVQVAVCSPCGSL